MSALFNTPLIPTLILGLLCAGLFGLYGALPAPISPEILTPEAKRRLSEDQLEQQASLADKIADAVVMVDQRERVIYANMPARTLLGLDELGKPLSIYIREPGVRDVIRETLAGSSPKPFTYKTAEPTERFIRISASPFTRPDPNGKRAMALLFLYDITEYKLLDSQRADFLANASHELKTPIASLLGYIETLRGHAKDDPEAQEKFLGIMQNQAERMQRLINDLLSLRRIEQVEHMAPSETADLYLAARAAIESVQPLAKKRRVNIDFSGDKNALVTGYQDELIQLVLNLLDNAVKISEANTNVTISVERTEQWQPGQAFSETNFSEVASNRRIVSPVNTDKAHYILTLRDHGPGFARDHLPRIGERFYRIAGDLSSKEKGTGLGLAIVKHITRRHRGGLLIQSGLSEGTEFIVLIPAADEPVS